MPLMSGMQSTLSLPSLRCYTHRMVKSERERERDVVYEDNERPMNCVIYIWLKNYLVDQGQKIRNDIFSLTQISRKDANG